jgi:hypothetical protein
MKTIQKLTLFNNQIGDKGVEYLSDALQSNQVNTNILFIYYTFVLLSHKDTQHPLSQ